MVSLPPKLTIRLRGFYRRGLFACKVLPRQRRLCSFRAFTGYRGMTMLGIITLISLVTMMYARDRVEILMTHAFKNTFVGLDQLQTYNFTRKTGTVSPAIQKELNLKLQEHEDTAADPSAPSPTGDYDYETARKLTNETLPEETGGETKSVWEIMKDFRPMPDITIHYIWCGSRFLDFRNYVSIKSAVDAIQPEKVIFHYKTLPMKDPDGYFTWFEMLQKQYQRKFVLAKLKEEINCYRGGFQRYALVFDVLKQYGGMYMPEDVIFLRIFDRFRSMNFVSGIASCNQHFFFEGIALARKGQFQVPDTVKAQVKMLSVCQDPSSLHPCMLSETYAAAAESVVPTCVRLHKTIFPKDVWTANDRVANLVKLVAYEKTDLQPLHHNVMAAFRTPLTGHYLCTDDCLLSFSFFISILSALHVAGLQQVLIHGPVQPSGVWWDRLQKLPASNRIYYLHRDFSFNEHPELKITNEMRRYIMRSEILLHYGGVFHDSRVIWTQPLPEQLLEYDAVASPDWHMHGNWPESVNHALIIARAGAQYVDQLLRMYRQHVQTTSPWFPDHYLAYRLIEMDPTLIYLYPHLQVKCLNHNCHPTWQPGYRSHFYINRPGQGFDWRKDTLSIHWLDTFPELDVDQIKFTTGFIVDVTRHVLSKAGIDVDKL